MVKNVVIVGSGAMGGGIAQISLMAQYNITLVDICDEFISRGIKNIKFGLEKLELKKKLKDITASQLLSSIKSSTRLSEAVKNADLMLEAVTEDLAIKKEVFRIAGENAPSHCIFASNTSSMSIHELGMASQRSEKVCGIHFFNPAPLMRLVEVIKAENTSIDTCQIAINWAKSLPCLRGKRYVPLVLKDSPGFIANRIQAPVSIAISWALDYAVDHNIPIEHVDNDLFVPVVPMSPLVLLDFVGLDISYSTSKYFESKLHPDFKPGKLISEKIEKGELGMKTGKGLYQWKGKIPPEIDRSKKADLLNLDLVLAIQANEGCRLLEEGVVKDWSTIDKTMRAGFNSLGPMTILADGNTDKWMDLLEQFSDKSGKEYLRPCEMMKSGKYMGLQFS
ncbi:MAG: hypothetical protein JW776_08445 [Candidatus Lokiarchaeota archaeon]|nr:hypothetical protein [Candidatus Lokiarchaeota archaeon]